MAAGNRIVEGILQSPAHQLLSGSTALVRYRGRRSDRVVTTPVQWAGDAAELVVLVAHPDRKRWWRNFVDGHEVEVLVRRRWLPMHGLVVDPASDPTEAERLLATYLGRFPKASKVAAGAVLVRCHPAAAPASR